MCVEKKIFCDFFFQVWLMISHMVEPTHLWNPLADAVINKLSEVANSLMFHTQQEALKNFEARLCWCFKCFVYVQHNFEFPFTGVFLSLCWCVATQNSTECWRSRSSVSTNIFATSNLLFMITLSYVNSFVHRSILSTSQLTFLQSKTKKLARVETFSATNKTSIVITNVCAKDISLDTGLCDRLDQFFLDLAAVNSQD